MRDPSKNFGDAAVRYQAFRPEYPQAVFDTLVHHVRSGSTHAVDLGAGSGQASATLAKLFDRVTAVEPDARLADRARLPENVTVKISSAEEIQFDNGSLDAIISATAFHWMDQMLVCARASRWLRQGGVFFPFAIDAFEVDGNARDFYLAEFDKWRAFRDPRLVENYDYARVLKESGAFENVIPFKLLSRCRLGLDEAVGLISTFSFARDYARVNGGDGYFVSLKAAFKRYGEQVAFNVPVIGAIGVKA